MTNFKVEKMKIGIVGANGFIGSSLLNYFNKKYSKITIKALHRQNITNNNLPNINWQTGDLTSKEICRSFIKNIDTLIYLAHTNTPLTSDGDPMADTQLNLVPLLNLLETIRESKNRIHIVYASSGGAVYGKSKKHTPFKEIDQCQPISSYGIQKMTAEHYLRIYSNWEVITATILRISNPYGFLLLPERKQGLIGIAMNQVLKNETIDIFSKISTVRDYIHLDDLSEAFLLSLNENSQFKVFNIGSGEGHSIAEVLNLIGKILKVKVKYKTIKQNDFKNSPDWNVLNIEKARKELNWIPKISLKDGIKRTYESISNFTRL